VSSETAITVKLPSAQELGALIEVMHTHPTGAVLAVAFTLAIALCIWAWRSTKAKDGRRE
jgi:hypothetical protein